jgi:hypothetical protein
MGSYSFDVSRTGERDHRALVWLIPGERQAARPPGYGSVVPSGVQRAGQLERLPLHRDWPNEPANPPSRSSALVGEMLTDS